MISETIRPDVARLQRLALIGGAVLIAVCIIGGLFNPAQFLHSYLFAFVFWLGLSLGCLAMLMLQHLVQGYWGFVSQRIWEAGARVLPLMAVLFLPILFGMRLIFPWAAGDSTGAVAEMLHKKHWYLNAPFFTIRAAVFFLVWILLAFAISRWSRVQDATGNLLITRRILRLSGPGLLIWGFTITFAMIDWVMSLNSLWYSTIFGMIFMVGQGLLALSFAEILLARLSVLPEVGNVVDDTRMHDLGNLTLSCVILWAYLSFSQLLITWAGNLPHEISFFVRRLNDGWAYTALFLIVFHFAAPFLFLLNRPLKRNRLWLAKLAAWMIFMRWVDILWMVEPSWHPTFYVHWLDVLMTLGMGGIWLGAFAWNLVRAPLFPQADPRSAIVLEALPAEHGH